MGDQGLTTLEELLAARERRDAKQKALVRKFSLPLVSFMVNMPGADKNSLLSKRIFAEGVKAFFEVMNSKEIPQVYREVDFLPTGAEGYIVVDCSETDLKAMTVAIEETHPLGRLFDFDVIGIHSKHLSRDTLEIPKRKCLLCDEEAHACGRSRKHSPIELQKKIQMMADAYFGPGNVVCKRIRDYA